MVVGGGGYREGEGDTQQTWWPTLKHHGWSHWTRVGGSIRTTAAATFPLPWVRLH